MEAHFEATASSQVSSSAKGSAGLAPPLLGTPPTTATPSNSSPEDPTDSLNLQQQQGQPVVGLAVTGRSSTPAAGTGGLSTGFQRGPLSTPVSNHVYQGAPQLTPVHEGDETASSAAPSPAVPAATACPSSSSHQLPVALTVNGAAAHIQSVEPILGPTPSPCVSVQSNALPILIETCHVFREVLLQARHPCH